MAVGVQLEDKIRSLAHLETFDSQFERNADFMRQEVFNRYHSETEMMRYIKRLERHI